MTTLLATVRIPLIADFDLRLPPPSYDLASLISGITVPSGQQQQGGGQQQQGGGQQAPTLGLHDLLGPAHTLPTLENVSEATIESLISNLPPAIVPANASLGQKKAIISRVLQSPQLTQGCASLTVALREGALRGVADSLRIPLTPGEENSATDPVETLINGVKRQVEKEGN